MTQCVVDLAARCGKLAAVVGWSRLLSWLILGGFASLGTTCAPAATLPAPPRQVASIAPADPHPGVEVAPALSAAAPADSAAGAPPPKPASCLEGAKNLDTIFQALADLESEGQAGKKREVVHIVQYGDSHTATDLAVSPFRKALQGRFGDAGRGFLPVGRPWKGYWQGTLHVGMSPDFKPARVKNNGKIEGTPLAYGLLGVGVESTGGGALAWTEAGVPFSHVELDFLKQPRGGAFDVYVDDVKTTRVASGAAANGSGFLGLDVPEAPHKIAVKTVGNGPVRVFGMTVDRPGGGVVVDTLGIVGAQIWLPLRWDEKHFVEQVSRRDPRLVILAYGTNEAVATVLTDGEYERELKDLIARVAKAGHASCLLLGPPDLARKNEETGEWMTLPRVLEIVAIQRRVAAQMGCAFYDQLAAMGGAGSMALWASEAEPRAMKDRTHLKPNGYAQVGTAFAADFLRAYDERSRGPDAPAVAASP
jgi:lysophospholipase L1-like esterase